MMVLFSLFFGLVEIMRVSFGGQLTSFEVAAITIITITIAATPHTSPTTATPTTPTTTIPTPVPTTTAVSWARFVRNGW